MFRINEAIEENGPLHIHWGQPSKTKNGPVNSCTHVDISALIEVQLYSGPQTSNFALTMTMHRVTTQMPAAMKDHPTGGTEPYTIESKNTAKFITFLYENGVMSVWEGKVPSVEGGGVKMFEGSSFLFHGNVVSITEPLVQLDVPSYFLFEWHLSFWTPGAIEVAQGPVDLDVRIMDIAYNFFCSDPTVVGG
jgi:hypothetical protein